MNDAELGWYVRSRGKVLGPFPLSQLEVLKNQGRLAKFDEVSRDRRIWVRAATIPELYPPPPHVEAASPDEPQQVYPVTGEHDAGGSAQTDVVTTWYYMTDQTQNGPITLAEMIQLTHIGVVRAETYVWNADLPKWVPARDVPLLSVTAVPTATAPTPAPAATGQGVGSLSLAGFVLGVLGVLSALLAFPLGLIPAASETGRRLLVMLLLATLGVSGLSAILAVTLGAIGMVRASKAGNDRRGYVMGMTGMILGIVGLVLLLLMVLIAVLGAIVVMGEPRLRNG